MDKPDAIFLTEEMELLATPKRVRVRFADTWIADSERAAILREKDHLPVYYFPWEDVREDLLQPSEHTSRCGLKGEASYWHVRVDDRVAEDAVWAYLEPVPDAAALAGYAAFYWEKMDAWFEEDEEVDVHPRDPYHRIDVRQSSRHVEVLIGDETVASTRRPLVLIETGLPPRYYIPRLDVRLENLVPSETRTMCPYKGEAHYYHAEVDGRLHEDILLSYPFPRLEAMPIAGMLCFFQEKVDRLMVDGVEQEKPETRSS